MMNIWSINRRLFTAFIVLGLATVFFFIQPATTVYAASPLVIVGYYDPAVGCVTTISGVFDLDTFTRDTLAGEVFSSWHIEALKANAVMIRSGALYYANYPQSSDPTVCKQITYPFSLRTSTYQGWGVGKGALSIGTSNNIPDDRVTDTQGQILRKNSVLFFPPFNDCAQNYTQQLATSTPPRDYNTILTSSTEGVYASTPASNCNITTYSGLGIHVNQYSFVPSMTNGTVPTALIFGSYSSSVTPTGVGREAEVYWGHAGLDFIRDNQFGQSGRYVVGGHTGDKVEFLMQFGGSYQYLYLIGIADKPGPVVLNIFIDGYYKQTMQWSNNDNARHLTTRGFGISYPFGAHAITVEFANDYVCTPSGPDCDRNFYFDVLAVMDVP
ncbi:MAG: SpoIID/LytB domain-containing protein [Caldilineaceae bacterium]